MLQIAMYDELSASNATGSLQNKCSVASQIHHSPDEASSIVEQEWQDQSESAMLRLYSRKLHCYRQWHQDLNI